jgi:hypothetical protein
MATSMFTPKDEGIDNWLFFLNRYLLDMSCCFYALNVDIAFGKQDDFT